MKPLIRDRLFKMVICLFCLRAATAFARALLPFDLPHVWRQVDTLGVAIRYWLRWTVEPELRYPLVPAVLNSMDGYAIMPMEFPLVNLLAAPFFAWGVGPGRVAALLFLFTVHFTLTWLCYLNWRDKKILGVRVEWAFLLLPVFAISSTFVTKFMPDYLAAVLVLLGMSFLWDTEHDRGEASGRASFAINRTLAMALMAIGLLVKPTSVTVLALLLLQDLPLSQRIRMALWTLPPLLAAGLYYTLGIKWMISLQDTPGLFAVQGRNPLLSLAEFLSEPRALFALFVNHMGFPGAPAVFALAAYFGRRDFRQRLLALTAVLVLQTLAIAALDGSHSFVHSYYHIGSAPTVSLMLMMTVHELVELGTFKAKVSFQILAALLLSQIYENSFFELRSLFGRKPERYIWPAEVAALKERNPDFPWGQGYTFRSSREHAYPHLGILFGEQEGSSRAAFGFYTKDEQPPAGCTVVDTSRAVTLVKCAP